MLENQLIASSTCLHTLHAFCHWPFAGRVLQELPTDTRHLVARPRYQRNDGIDAKRSLSPSSLKLMLAHGPFATLIKTGGMPVAVNDGPKGH